MINSFIKNASGKLKQTIDSFTSNHLDFIHCVVISNLVVYDTIVKLDEKIKHHFINLIAKKITEFTIHKMKDNTLELRRLSGAIDA